mmetsp:Transcript_6667/g.14731  ORF Transcript_6667/g.14731 Transcript_6667/m.14731 type:complete len:382 (+) Transcript_6667:435-1580(+)
MRRPGRGRVCPLSSWTRTLVLPTWYSVVLRCVVEKPPAQCQQRCVVRTASQLLRPQEGLVVLGHVEPQGLEVHLRVLAQDVHDVRDVPHRQPHTELVVGQQLLKRLVHMVLNDDGDAGMHHRNGQPQAPAIAIWGHTELAPKEQRLIIISPPLMHQHVRVVDRVQVLVQRLPGPPTILEVALLDAAHKEKEQVARQPIITLPSQDFLVQLMGLALPDKRQVCHRRRDDVPHWPDTCVVLIGHILPVNVLHVHAKVHHLDCCVLQLTRQHAGALVTRHPEKVVAATCSVPEGEVPADVLNNACQVWDGVTHIPDIEVQQCRHKEEVGLMRILGPHSPVLEEGLDEVLVTNVHGVSAKCAIIILSWVGDTCWQVVHVDTQSGP